MRGKKLDQNLFKSTKKAIALCKISKNFPGEHAFGPPRAVFSSICSAGKTCAYMAQFGALPKKNWEYVSDIKN